MKSKEEKRESLVDLGGGGGRADLSAEEIYEESVFWALSLSLSPRRTKVKVA